MTGYRGVLGSEIIRLASKSPSFEILKFEGDVRSSEDINGFFRQSRKIDALIHCASIVPVSLVRKDPLIAYDVNVLGTGRTCSSFYRHNPAGQFVYISSSHVYKARETGFISENSEIAPITSYGRSKFAGELLANDLAEMDGRSLTILRLFSMYSSLQKGDFLYPSIVRKLRTHRTGEPFTLQGWNNVRDFSSAENHAKKILFTVSRAITGTVNIGSGRGQTIGEFAEQIAGYKLKFREDNLDAQPTRIVADISLSKKLGVIDG